GAHPANVEDVASALAWVHDHAAEYGGDPARIFLMGHSAGAHLAALAAVSGEPLAKAGKDRSIVKGVVPLDTNAYNIPRLMNEGGEFYGQVFGEDPEVWRDASPISHIEEGVGIPPFLICYTRGMRVDLNAERPVQANGFAEALRASGIPATVVDATDRNHGEINAWFGAPDDERVTGAAIDFLEAILSDSSPTEADSAPAPKGEVTFQQDYVAGTRDAAGEFLGGTETMHLVAHKGMLFAGNGYWTDQPGDDPRPGAQILRKDGPDTGWQLDRNFPGAVRINAMKSVTFTLDANGTDLVEPVRLLVADAGLANSRSLGPLSCYVRDDESGEWAESSISDETDRAYIRVFGFHRDAETGREHIFAGTGAGELYRGSYDPEVAGSIRWESEPEYANPDFDSGPFKRCQGFCVANGKLYASVSPRLLERQDGPEPKWVEVFRWEPEERAGAGMRGITAVKVPNGEHEVILGSREQEGRILRIDPLDGYSVTEELRSHKFLDEELGHFRGGKLVAYNRFIPGSHPATGEPIHWLTVAGVKADDARAAWLLMRKADASYEVVRVFDPSLDPHPFLVSTRTLEFAPW
ncbi:MAG: alpha/beta hydrolase, partial [Verrucomicrobiota bacterium]